MDPYKFTIYIPYNDFVFGVLLIIFAIISYLTISKHRENLKPLFGYLLTPSKYALPLLLFILVPLALIAVYDIYGLITSPEAWEADKRGLAVLLAAIVGAPFVIWRTWIAQKQSATAEQSHMTDRISKAVEQLGAEKTIWEDGEQRTVPNLEVRLGAIYALERIAQDSLRDHIPVMEILCAYVRLNSPNCEGNILKPFHPTFPAMPSYLPESQKTEIALRDITREKDYREKLRNEVSEFPSPRLDIQAALTVIGRSPVSEKRLLTLGSNKINLSKCNLQKAELVGDFSNADFSESLIDGATVVGNFENVNLEQASIQCLWGDLHAINTIQGLRNRPPKF